MIDLGTFEEMARMGRLEPIDIARAYNRIMELDGLNSAVRRQAGDKERRREAWKRSVIHYAVSQATRYGLECSLPRGDRE